MGSLTTCLKKAGTAISAENKAAVIDRARALREEGKEATEAALQAVDEQIAAVQGRLEPEQAAESNAAALPDRAKKPGTVENFGEALPPSRRQRQAALDADLSDDDIASKPLSEIWPLAENDAIEDTFAAAVAHAARAAIPAKPRKGYKLDRWVDSVKTVRQLAQFITSGQYTREQFIAKVPKTYALQHFMSKVALLEAVDRKHWKRIGEVSEFPESFNYEDGKKIPSPQVSVTIDGKHHWLRGSGSIADHIVAVSGLLGDAAPDKRMEFEVRGSGTSFGINKKGDSEYRRLMEFPTAAEALKARSEKYDELVAAWEAVKDRDNVTERDLRSAENKDRIGPDYRNGRDISGDEFDATFGFKGGEFGKWVSQGKGDKERQWMLNRAYDALMDLAGIVGVPPRAISLNGTLGIAFGSRGTGWASAHFEPGNLVINLTKTRGAGALAHEWFHALDNYFARARGGEVAFTGDQLDYRKNNYVTYKPEPMMVGKGPGFRGPMRKAELERRRAQNPESKYYLPEHWQVDPKHPEGVRPVVEERFAALVEALDAAPMTKRARMIDDSAEGYWSRIIERAARSFESYVIHRMMEKGHSNEYLANVTKFQDFKRDKGRYPYPTPDEIKPVAEAFDALFSTLETRTDEAGNVALQNIARTAQTETPAFRAWFGDSKVVDAQGRPLVVYHGTKAEFTEFKRTKSGEFGPAIYLTDSPREAGEYGDGKGWGGPSGTAVMPVYVSIKNPYTKGVDAFWQEFGAADSDAAALERAQAAGFDGIIAKRADRYYDNDAREFVDRGGVLTHFIAFHPEQIKSAIGNSGAFDPANPSIVANLSRVGETIGRMGYERQDTPRIQAARKLTGLVKRLEEGQITSAHFELAVRLLAGEMDRVVLTKAANRLMTERERGPDIVREKLIAGRRRGELDSDMVDFALWALEQNPSLADNLGITVMAQKEGATGDYNPTSEIMRVFKYAADNDTAVHEIMHHAERMMPADMQAAIRKEWAAALAATIKRSTPEQVKALEAISGALVGDKASYKALVKAIQEGPLNYDEHYQLVNPSEFFAVNGARLLGKDFAAKDSVWARIKVWLRNMVEKIKAILGLRSDAPILKALAYVMDRENFGPERGGRFESGVMLSDVNTIMASGVLNQISADPQSPWFSALSRAAESIPMKAGPASAWKAAIKNWVSTGKVKADELAWTGLEDWIELQTGKVTKDAVSEFLAGNGVKVTETVLGAQSNAEADKVMEKWGIVVSRNPEDESQVAFLDRDNPEDLMTGDELENAGYPIEAVRAAMEIESGGVAVGSAGFPKYSQYTLPGGTNYREVLLTLPSGWRDPKDVKRLQGELRAADAAIGSAKHGTEAWTQAEARAKDLRRQLFELTGDPYGNPRKASGAKGRPDDYRSGHWDQPNVLAHIRVNDRTAMATAYRVENKRSLNAGRILPTRAEAEADMARYPESIRPNLHVIETQVPQRVLFVEEIQSDWGQAGKKEGFKAPFSAETHEVIPAPISSRDTAVSGFGIARKGDPDKIIVDGVYSSRSAAEAALAEGGIGEGVPRAPFVGKTDAWVSLAMKRVIKMAVDGGYDKVAFVTGEQSADRYDLSKQIQTVRLTTTDKEGALNGAIFNAIQISDGRAINRIINSAQELEDVIGKDVAAKLLAADPTKGKGGNTGGWVREVSGLDLKVGGEGMRAFYDKIVPSVAKDVLRKVGGGAMETVTLGKSPQRSRRDEVLAELGKQPTPDLTQPGFTITDAMREKASGGMPLFNIQRTRRELDEASPTGAVVPGASPREQNAITAIYKKRVLGTLGRLDMAVNGLGDLPDSEQFLAQRYRALGTIALIDEMAGKIRLAFGRAKAEDKRAVYDYLTTAGATPDKVADEKVRKAAADVKKYIGAVGDKLVEKGLLSPESRELYRDQYLPRMYLSHLLEEGDWRAIGGGKKVSDMGYLKKRKDIPQAIRDVILGEVKDPAFLASVAVAKPMRDMALLDWLDQISEHHAWVFPASLAEWAGKKVSVYWLKAEADALRTRARLYPEQANREKAVAIAGKMDELAEKTLGEANRDHKDYSRIPNTPQYGRLRGMLVRTEIYNDLMGTHDMVPKDGSWAESVLGYGGIGTKATQLWKASKVSLNVPGQIRNVISNGVLLQLSGVPLHRFPVYIARFIKQYRYGGKHWDVARKYGVTESTFQAHEVFRAKRDLIDLEKSVRGMTPMVALKTVGATIMDWAGDTYQFAEAMFKTMKIMDEMERNGKSEDEAALEAQKWLFDYSLLDKNIRYLRNAPVGAPFLTFTTKVLPRLAEVALLHPQRFLPWVGMSLGLQMWAQAVFGGDDDEWEHLKKALPKWMHNKPHTAFLPFRDDAGRLQAMDLSYYFPWSQYAEASMAMASGEPMDAMRNIGIFGGPLPSIMSAIQTGKDPFTQREIINPGDPPAEKAKAMIAYVWDLAMPPMMASQGVVSPLWLMDPAYGGKVAQAATGATNRRGDPRATMGQAVARVVGANVYGIDPTLTRESNLAQMRADLTKVRSRMASKLGDQGLTAVQRKQIIEDYQAEFLKRRKELDEYATKSKVPAFAKTDKQAATAE